MLALVFAVVTATTLPPDPGPPPDVVVPDATGTLAPPVVVVPEPTQTPGGTP